MYMKPLFALLFTLVSITIITNCNSSNSKNKNLKTTASISSENQSVQSKQKGDLEFNTDLEFYKGDKTIQQIKVAIAKDPSERNQGLMGVEDLKEDQGMLFLFEDQKPLSFWMANTPLSLDIIFVNESYEIVRIHSFTEPYSTQNYKSEKDAKYVVEVNAGFCVNNDIIEGDTIGFEL